MEVLNCSFLERIYSTFLILKVEKEPDPLGNDGRGEVSSTGTLEVCCTYNRID